MVKIKKLKTLKGTEPFYFSKDGKNLFCLERVDQGEYINVYDIESEEKIKTFELKLPINNFSISNNLKFLVTANIDGSVSLWDYKLNKIIKTIALYTEETSKVIFHPKSKLFLSSGFNKTNKRTELGYFETVGLTKILDINLKEHLNIEMEDSCEILVSPDGKYFSTHINWGKGLDIRDIETGSLIKNIFNENEPSISEACFSNNNQYLGYFRLDGNVGTLLGYGGVYISEIATQGAFEIINEFKVIEFKEEINKISFNYNSKLMLILIGHNTREFKIRIYDIKQKTFLEEFNLISGEKISNIRDLISNPVQNNFALAFENNIIEIWELME